MIGKLSGKISEVGIDHVIIDVNGVGYMVFCSSKITNRYNIGDEMILAYLVLLQIQIKSFLITF